MNRERVSIVIVAIAIAVSARDVTAHKPVTSKYTYHQDVLPIFRDKCGACHRRGGVAPMSLMTYEEAFPWAESIRAELIAGHMPPASADPGFGAVQHNRVLTAQETDVILTWATGGNPRGTAADVPAIADGTGWTLGTPDLVLKLPETTLPADKSEDVREFTLKSQTTSQWVRAVDVRPGTASLVRNVSIVLKPDRESKPLMPEQVLCRWIPGQLPVDISKGTGAAILLPAGTELIARVHYKKTWQYDGKPMTDASAIGLYFTSAPGARKLLAIPLDAPKPVDPAANTTYTVDIPEPVEALNIRVDEVPADVIIQVEGVPPDGKPIPMIRFSGRANWECRYWFVRPIVLPAGSRVEVRTRYADPTMVADAFGGLDKTALAQGGPAQLRIALDVAAAAPAAPSGATRKR